MIATMLITVACVVTGCSQESDRLARRTVAIGDVPENVMEAAKKVLPDVDFQDAWKNVQKNGDLHSYEIRGRTGKGKIREVRVSPQGEVLEME
jgi:hypothetical protein